MSGQVLDRRSPPGDGALPDAGTAASPAAGRRGRVRLRRVLIPALGLAAAAGIGWYAQHWWQVGRFIESTDDAYVGGDVTAIAPKVSGFVAEVAADNQAVRAGDLLVRLDDRDYRAALARARGVVAQQEATLANLDANRDLQLAVIAGARAKLDATAAEVARARYDADRYQRLSADQFASAQRFQQADADWRKAVASDREARAAAGAAEQQLAVIDTQKRQTRALLDQARAEEDTARLALGYTELRAPVDGVVGNRSARVGAYATPGAQLLALVPARGLWVDANFKESQLARMRPGMAARVTADAVPGRVFAGRVASLAPATGAQFSVIPPENATGNFTKIVQRVPVRILLDEEAGTLGALRPGLSVTAEVDERAAVTGAVRAPPEDGPPAVAGPAAAPATPPIRVAPSGGAPKEAAARTADAGTAAGRAVP